MYLHCTGFKKYFLFTCGVFLAGTSIAQSNYLFYTRKLTVKDGLAHQEVHTVCQDNRGFIWIGTRFGLNRFDGYNFITYTKEKNKLSANNIHHIIKDEAGMLWLFEEGGINRKDNVEHIDILDPLDGKVKSFEQQFTNAPFTAKDISTFFASPNGRLYIYAAGKLYSIIQNKITPIALLPNFQPVACAGSNGFWGYNGLQYVKIDMQGKVRYTSGMALRFIEDVFDADENNLFVAAWNGRTVNIYGNPSFAKPMIPGELTGIQPTIIYPAAKNKFMWVSWGKELFAFNVNGQAIYNLTKEAALPSERAVIQIFADKQGVIWAASEAGLWMIEIKPQLFTRYLYKPITATTSPTDLYQCRGISQYNSTLFVNTYRGSCSINLTNNNITTTSQLRDEVTNKDFAFRFGLYNDSGKRLLAASNAIIEKDIATGTERRVSRGIKKRFWCTYRDGNGQLLIGSEKGLYIMGSSTADTVAAFRHYNQFKDLAASTILQIVDDKKGSLWLATSTGLYQYNNNKGITAQYNTQQSGDNFLPADNIQHIYIDSAGIFWLATEGNGLISWNRQLKKVKAFTNNDGLSSNNIYAVYEDRKGYLWMSSDYGLMRMHKQNGQIVSYTPDDGITHYEFNRVSSLQAADGRLYFGSLNGITAFYPEQIDEQSNAEERLTLSVASFQQYIGKKEAVEELTKQLVQTGIIELAPSDKYIDIRLQLPEFANADKAIYYYKIEGLDDEWVKAQGNNVRIGRLPYGNYTLYLKAQAGNGALSEQISFALLVKKPVYLRWWFLLLAVLCVAFAVRIFYQWRIRQLQQRRKELETTVAERTSQIEHDKKTIQKQADELMQIDEMKSKFFANVSHELRTPLTLLTGPVNRLIKNTGQQEENYPYLQLMQQNVQQLQNRVNEILDLSKLDAGKLELKPESINLHLFLQPVAASFQTLADAKKIAFSFTSLVPKQLNIAADKGQLTKILNNILSNALRYTPAGGSVKFEAAVLDEKLIFKVTDTGIGINADEQQKIFKRFYQGDANRQQIKSGSGIGLALTSELVELMQGKITLESTLGSGSVFTVILPKVESAAPIAATNEEEQLPLVAITTDTGTFNKTNANILLVEDNINLQKFIQLELKNYNISIAHNGAEALQLLQQAEKLPDMIISDIMMPVMDGFALLEQLKTGERYKKIPVIMLTARTDMQDRLQALRIGVDDYLVKPFVTEELEVRIQNLLQRKFYRENPGQLPDDEIQTANTGNSNDADIKDLPTAWLKLLETAILGYLDKKENFTLDTLAAGMFISKRQLQRNIKEATGITANNYIKEIRLHRARLYLESNAFATVAEVSYAVGFNDQHYFSTIYAERFGKKPIDYL